MRSRLRNEPKRTMRSQPTRLQRGLRARLRTFPSAFQFDEFEFCTFSNANCARVSERTRAEIAGSNFNVLLRSKTAGLLRSGKQFKCIAVLGTNNTEVPVIECGDSNNFEALSQSDEACIGPA